MPEDAQQGYLSRSTKRSQCGLQPSPHSGNQRGAEPGPIEDAAINDKLSRFHGLLGSNDGPEVNHWGRRQLAYPIGSRENGYYVVSRFNVEPTVLPEYERALRLDDGVIRYLITVHDHEVGAPALSDEELAAQAARRDDDDDDED